MPIPYKDATRRAEKVMTLSNLGRHTYGDESGVSLTVQVLLGIPLAIAAFGFLVNGALHWIGMQYAQSVTNDAAKYTAAAIGNNNLPYIPGGGFDMKPSEYLTSTLGSFALTIPIQANCRMVSNTTVANGIARCDMQYRTLSFPTDPLTRAVFGKPIVTSAESLSETGINPDVQ